MPTVPAGFKKDEVRALLENKGHLRVRGERPVEAGSSKWVRFSKDLKLPDNCDIGGIHEGKFQNKKLTITLPKKNPPDASAPKPAPTAEKSRPPVGSAPEPPPTTQQEEKNRPPPLDGSVSEPAPAVQEQEHNRPWAPGSYALKPTPAAQEEEGTGRPSPSGASGPEPAPAVQEEKKSHPSPPDGSASEPAPAVQGQEKSRPSPPDSSAPEPTPPPPPLIQEKKNSLPSPPDGCASEPAVAVQEEDEDEEGTTMVEIEMAGGRRPIHWLLVAVAALSFVGITGYVVWRKLRSGCSAAGAGDHGPGELAGAGTFIDEM